MNKENLKKNKKENPFFQGFFKEKRQACWSPVFWLDGLKISYLKEKKQTFWLVGKNYIKNIGPKTAKGRKKIPMPEAWKTQWKCLTCKLKHT